MNIYHPDVMSALLCAVFATAFAIFRTLADNRDVGARGRPLAWLIFVNGLCGLGGGALTTPAVKLLTPHLGLEARFVAAALVGWYGLDAFMSKLKTKAEFLKETKEVEGRLPHDTHYDSRSDPSSGHGSPMPELRSTDSVQENQ